MLVEATWKWLGEPTHSIGMEPVLLSDSPVLVLSAGDAGCWGGVLVVR